MVSSVGPNQVSKGREGAVVRLDSFHVVELLLAFGLRVSEVLSFDVFANSCVQPFLRGQ